MTHLFQAPNSNRHNDLKYESNCWTMAVFIPRQTWKYVDISSSSLSLSLTFIFSTSTSSLPIFHIHIPFQELGCEWITYYSKVNVTLYQCHIQLIVKYAVHKTENKTIVRSKLLYLYNVAKFLFINALLQWSPIFYNKS